MTTKISIAQTDSQARIMVSAFKQSGFNNIAVNGADTTLDIFGVSQSARWIVIASKKQIAVSSSPAVAGSDDTNDILNGEEG